MRDGEGGGGCNGVTVQFEMSLLRYVGVVVLGSSRVLCIRYMYVCMLCIFMCRLLLRYRYTALALVIRGTSFFFIGKGKERTRTPTQLITNNT